MRVSRRMPAGCAAMALILMLAACTGGTAAPRDTASSATALAPSASAPSASASPAAPASSEPAAPTPWLVSLDEVCTLRHDGLVAPAGFTVGLVTGIGTADDGTFNQRAFEGLQAAQRCFGADTVVVETANTADYGPNLEAVLAEKPDVVVTVGVLLAQDTLAAARRNPDVTFIGVDQFQAEYGGNYAGVLFREDQTGFLAGAVAALLTQSATVGVVGGLRTVPSFVGLVNGFERGARHIAAEEGKDVTVLSTYHESLADDQKGALDASDFLEKGADVVFGAAETTGSAAIAAAAADGAWVIGVNNDEYHTTFDDGAVPGAQRLATSVIKRVDLGVFELIAGAVDGNFQAGVFTLDAANNGITYAPFHDADLPAAVRTRLERTRMGLADGAIETGLDEVTGLPE